MVGGAQVEVPVKARKLEQEPDLLLAFVMAARITADIALRHLVAQPVTGTGHNCNMLRLEPHFLMQFAVHGLLWGFAPVNAALRKLPRMGAYAFAPKNLIFLVEQDDADVGPKPIPVKHNQTPNF